MADWTLLGAAAVIGSVDTLVEENAASSVDTPVEDAAIKTSV